MDADTSDGSSPHPPEHAPASATRLACDLCRSRKVGCDRQKPCGNCRRANADCLTTLKPRTSVPRQRVRVSTGYDQKINNIEERVEEALELLRQLTSEPTGQRHVSKQSQPQTALPAVDQPSTSSTMTSVMQMSPKTTSLNGSRSSRHTVPLRVPTQTPVEGDSSFVAQTVIASDMLNTTLGSSPDVDPRFASDLDSAVTALRTIMRAQKEYNAVHDLSWASGSSSDPVVPATGQDPATLVPVDAAMTALRYARENPQTHQVWFVGFNILTFDQLMEHLVRVYFPGPYTETDYIITNGGLGCVFNERLDNEDDPEIRRQLKAYRDTCNSNLEMALSSFPALAPATFENIKALSFGAMRALFTARPAIMWAVTSKALDMCQTLGYHRVQTHAHDAPAMREQKIWMFWVMYMTSMAVSLRLGRPSVMPEYDISVQVPKADETSFNRFSNAVVRCMQFSRVQGRIYEVLYSYSALSQQPRIRAHRASLLADDLRAVYLQVERDRKRTQEKWGDRNGFHIKIEQFSSELTYNILRTLILRAVPVGPGSNTSLSAECLDAARTTFEKHQEYMPQMNAFLPPDFYFKAILLYMPFTPYIVLFCHVIETSNAFDFERLRAFNDSIETLELTSESCKNLRQLFQSLFHVAKVYVKSRSRTPAGTHMSGGGSGGNDRTHQQDTAETAPGFSAPCSADQNTSGVDDSTVNHAGMQLDAYLRQMGMLPPQNWNQVSEQTPYSADSGHDPVLAHATAGGVGLGESAGMMLDLDPMAVSDDYYGMGAGAGVGELPQNASYLADWFSGNQQILAMMDDNVF